MLGSGILVTLLFGVTMLGAAEDVNNEVIDLQDLLRNVSYALKEAKEGVLNRTDASSHLRIRAKPRDCADIQQTGNASSGVYRIWPESWEHVGSFEVYCDMTTDGGGWTVFQKRGDFGLPRDEFYKTWNEYKNGFGDLAKEFWLGNDRIFSLTNQDSYELRIDMWDLNNATASAKYNKFWIENEDQQYRAQMDQYSGDSGDSMGICNGMKFTTKDRKNDLRTDGYNCADLYKGGWWYTKCHSANLNGLNLRGEHASYADGIEWETWKGYRYSLAKTEMKIRPVARTV